MSTPPSVSAPQHSKPLPSGSPAPEPSRWRERSWLPTLLMLMLLTGMWLLQGRWSRQLQPEVDYSAALGFIEQGHVTRVVVSEQRLEGELDADVQIDGRNVRRFEAVTPKGDDTLLPLLRAKGVHVRAAANDSPMGMQLLLSLLPWLFFGGLWFFMSRRTQNLIGQSGLGGIVKPTSHRFEKNIAVDVGFNDVAGLRAAKQDLMEVVEFLKEPERFARLGGKIPHGILLVGPPGTGKTLLARAVAGESKVPFFSISGSEFIEMFVGVGAARVRELFAEAKRNAPAIVFIDEIDAVGRARGTGLGGGHDEREQTLNQLLSEMDGFNRNDLTIVIAATNRPDVLDPALLRPGRFDRRVMVERPEAAARTAILKVHTKNKPLANDVVLEELANGTPGFSGADLASLVNEAALHATRTGASSIGAQDFAFAYDKIVLGDARETCLAPEEKRRVAVHEAGHALVAHVCDARDALRRVSILPRGMALGATQQLPAGDRHLTTEKQLQARLAVLMGGYACERLLLGSISSGAENDLKEAMKIAAKMVANYGMSAKLGPVHYERHIEHPFLGQTVATDHATSDSTQQLIEGEVRQLLSQASTRAQETLQANRTLVERLVAALIEHETLEQDALARILAPAASPEHRPVLAPLGPASTRTA